MKGNGDNEIIRIIKEEGVFNSESTSTVDISGDIIEVCISASNYVSPMRIRQCINPAILYILDKQEFTEAQRFKISEIDKSHLLLVYFITNYYYEQSIIKQLVKLNDDYLRKVGAALVIINELPALICDSDNFLLYKYFRAKEIKGCDLDKFSHRSFFEYIKSKILEEEKVIFIWLINNLKKLVNCGVLDINQDQNFFTELLKKTEYPNETHYALYKDIIELYPSFFSSIQKNNLDIDPFTKQVDFSKWLNHIEKFKFYLRLRQNLPQNYSDKSVDKFDSINNEIKKVYKFEI